MTLLLDQLLWQRTGKTDWKVMVIDFADTLADKLNGSVCSACIMVCVWHS